MSAANPPESLSWTFLRAHPEDAARVLESLPPADVIALMQALPARITARALSNLRPSLAAEPHPHRELTLMPRGGVTSLTVLGAPPPRARLVSLRSLTGPRALPRLSMAAGALSLP